MKTSILIPTHFILANAHLNWDEVRFGLEKGFIGPEVAVEIAMDCVSRKEESTATEIDLAGVLRTELYRVPELVGLLAASQSTESDAKSTWLYLLLAWLYERRESFDRPLELIEEIYADFDYPQDMSCFVRYMPPSDGYRPQDHSPQENHERLIRLWHEYLLKHRRI